MTRQDDGETELWERGGCIRRSRCCGRRGVEDRDESKQRDCDFHHLTQNPIKCCAIIARTLWRGFASAKFDNVRLADHPEQRICISLHRDDYLPLVVCRAEMTKCLARLAQFVGTSPEDNGELASLKGF
jgi:hypothetical protein